ncbi:DUF4271 domain-containing protein [Mucilaginibacter achroorhodeus]|uniref:DUF4271 domain-containing protein n=1 Tax=Mucilaginibacter achroorhodeus TaxID=2599294 RepID=A0A563TYS6_9SPHI|nr:DUF4271 domain-containing protein [Mucilaginibacter achroorhodeus]TWR23751.1 DUF4271 domain-containing protein [Mucilaginibacter achroorhodeus]
MALLRWLIVFVLITLACSAVHAQTSADTGEVAVDTPVVKPRPRFTGPLPFLDSVARASALREQFVSDSLAKRYISAPDPNRPNAFVDSILKANAYKNDLFLNLSTKASMKQGYGRNRPSRDIWVVGVIMVLLLFAAGLNIASTKDVSNVFQSFYHRKAAGPAGKEESPINAWTFIGLFILFGLTSGMFLYLLTTGYYKVYYTISGVQLFLTLSIVIIALFAVKFLVLKFLGFVFDISKLVDDYIATLSLTYFNITFVFLPVAVCFSLIADAFIPLLLIITLALVIIIFVWQYLRSSVSIITNFRFHKFYLFVYLCALEICPILILIKALNIGFR